ncbi:arsenical pump-driving ATPase [Alteribacter aurantiacus]|uniref:arsenical pump-driving ATPase n=1 Tax=Alteribacter aurantiacus TaxID=254410 RepID=UPI0003FEAC51|nr:arsenical pump-driving ATPase [Alteribacter aurantiacus]
MYTDFSIDAVSTTPFLFFTGKGGVGKTSTASATAVGLADKGNKVLLVSTDPASNLQDVFGMDASLKPISVPEVDGLFMVNIDPEAAAFDYRERVVGPYRNKLPEAVVNQMEEQLSGACTVEIAAFNEFASLLTKKEVVDSFDHILFDTAPTGHTLRLLQLPAAWSGFLDESTHGASCLGPLSGLGDKKALYENTVEALSDDNQTTLILVTRPDRSSIQEAGRTAEELKEIGLTNQRLLLNGLFEEKSNDPIAHAFYTKQQIALKPVEEKFIDLPVFKLPYIAYPLTGMDALRRFLKGDEEGSPPLASDEGTPSLPGLDRIIHDLSPKQSGVVMTMGKGGVGKTTMATAIALGLVSEGKKVHLTTTDPAAHLHHVIEDKGLSDQLTVSTIDPQKEVEKYRAEVLAQSATQLDEKGLAYLKEDLESPCTEEIAVFRAFANVVERADQEFVVIDTAPTGHTLLLLDASSSYNKEIERSTGEVPHSVRKLLPRLRNRDETFVAVVTLPEATPVLEASRLQGDLKRAGITPAWWIVNQSMAKTHTKHPLLLARASSERQWIDRSLKENKNTVVLPWFTEDLTGTNALMTMFRKEVR